MEAIIMQYRITWRRLFKNPPTVCRNLLFTKKPAVCKTYFYKNSARILRKYIVGDAVQSMYRSYPERWENAIIFF